MTRLLDQIIAADDIERVEYEIPEWGVTVEIRSISAGQRAQFIGAEGKDLEDSTNLMLLTSVFDPESGLPVFASLDEVALVTGNDDHEGKNMRVVTALLNKVLDVSGITDDAETDLGNDSSA